MLVKICGLTTRDDVEAAVTAGADLLGFVFVPGTPRAIEAADVRWVRDVVGAQTVGVFRDAPLETVIEVRKVLDLDWVQLHGDEPDSFLNRLGEKVLRRVEVSPEGIDWRRVGELATRCLPLIDPGAGDGVALDWKVLAGGAAKPDFGLAGGLTPETVSHAIAVARPCLVDVSSGVERAPGVKDHARVEAFVAAAKDHRPNRTCPARIGAGKSEGER